jgi:2-polyprenyl-3-methyl-5-hydroxy-6-metoxy-1,4-benzoquinol methylase
MVLRAVPANSARALDVGCGRGLLAYKLAEKCREVIAIDAGRDTLSQAGDSIANPSFIEGDVMT